jgi:creatinine amidohydrolase
MHESVKLLEQRCLASPDFVRSLAFESLQPVATVLQFADCIFITGVGASEGPARLLASCLLGQHRHVRFIPLSGLIAGDHRPWLPSSGSSRLVVFSQALSPNAQMALDAGKEFTTTILFCGPNVRVDETASVIPAKQLIVIRHPPESEMGFLVRVTGPAVASAMALALAELVTSQSTNDELRARLHQCANAMETQLHAGLADVDFVQHPPTFLVYGIDGVERNHLLRWTLLECLDKHDPSSWELLAFAHGAFQNIFDTSRTLLLPRALDDAALDPLVERLRVMLSQTRHTLIELRSELPRPWCLLEHLAAVQALMLGYLRQNPRDLNTWPGHGRDGALYTLDRLPGSE